MKKIISATVFLVLMAWAGTVLANPIPFQVDDSALTVEWDSGGGYWDYEGYSSDLMHLDCGESFDVTFGKIWVPLAIGDGEAELTIDFTTPNPDGTVSDTAQFWVISFFFFSAGELDFGAPEIFGYSYNGVPGGLFEVDLDDLAGIQCGTWLDVTGTITNLVCPVPEPGTFLLFGAGLACLAGLRMRKKA